MLKYTTASLAFVFAGIADAWAVLLVGAYVRAINQRGGIIPPRDRPMD